MRRFLILAVAISFLPCRLASGDGLSDDALEAAKKATRFLVDEVSTEGGYLWRYSTDLKLREGEGVVDSETVWVQPPGTPAVGEAFVQLFRATGDTQFLDAALASAEALRRGQMRSGGWQASIEFEPDRRKRWAYRVDAPARREKDQSSLDDDKTQSALRFLIQLDASLDFDNESIHEMTLYGLDGLINRGQFSGGGFPQVWTDQRDPSFETPRRAASYPESWPRVYQGHNEYWYRYTLNDHLARDVMKVLFAAEDAYQDPRYRKASLRLADSLLAAQMPSPQPAWAQQYNAKMQPIWARKFEPTAITTSESFSVIETLMMVYAKTGESKYLEPIPRALDYLQSCELSDGRVARFYEMKTNRPLYFTRDYKLTYDDGDMPTHYGFQLQSRVDQLRKKYQRFAALPKDRLAGELQDRRTPSPKTVRRIIQGLDDRGAWVSDEPMRYHRHPGPTIEMAIAVKNLTVLANYLENTYSNDR